MRRLNIFLTVLLISMTLGAAGISESKRINLSTVRTTSSDQSLFTQSVQQFSDQLFFVQDFNGKNAMLSPLSVSLALGMTTNGATGSTLSSMLDVLVSKPGTLEMFNDANKNYLDSIKNLTNVEFSIANSLWLNQEIRFDLSFLSKTKDIYHASAKNLDFSASNSLTTINSWVSNATRGTIKTILDSVDIDSRMYLINAVYFKGDWMNPFKKENTYEQDFIMQDEDVSVPFMHQSVQLPYAKAMDGQMLMMPYTDERFALVAILPAVSDDINSWLLSQKGKAGFTRRLFEAVESLKLTRMELSIPKFEASYTDSLVDELKLLGMTEPFDSKNADFSLIVESRGKDLVIGEVLHKTFIRVDEKGSEAAAVTSIMMKATSMPMHEELELSFERPFFYAIIDRQAKIPLFMGILENPLVK